MTQRACRFFLVPLAFVLALAAPGAVRAQLDTLPADGQNALKTEYQDKWASVWTKLMNGDPVADPADEQHKQAVDAAAKWATYRLTWGLEKDPGKLNDVVREFNGNLQTIRDSKERATKLSEMYTKQVIVHALEVLQTRKAVARINAARVLARIPEKTTDESQGDVAARLAGTNGGDLADALAGIIKDPQQNDGARYWALRALRLLLTLPPQATPVVPREKEEAAVGAVIKFLQDRSNPFPPGTPQDEIDGFRYLRREAIEALAQCRYPTLADKSQPTFVLLKIAARDGVVPEPRLDERVEAVIGVARAQPEFDKDYQPDYAAHQMGLFVADFVTQYAKAKQGNPDDPATMAWKVDASRLIEALELMKAQTKNAHVARVTDESLKLLTKIEKALVLPNGAFDLEQFLKGEASPSQQLYKGVPESVVKAANRKEADAPDKPEEKKDK